MSESDSIEVNPSSVPANTKIILMSFSEHDEFTKKFGESIKDLVFEIGRYIDLSLLDGVTVGFDYEAALQLIWGMNRRLQKFIQIQMLSLA